MFRKKNKENYRVTLINEAEGTSKTIEVGSNEYILDVAEEQNVALPYACRTGACVVCTGKVIKGSVDQSDYSFLKPREIDAGFTLLCATYPMSDCVIKTHQEDALLDL